MDTIITNKYPTTDEEFRMLVCEKITPDIQYFVKSMFNMQREMKSLFAIAQSLYLYENNMYLDHKLKILMPNLRDFEEVATSELNTSYLGDYFNDKILFGALRCELPTLSQLCAKKNLLMQIYKENCYFVCRCDDKRATYYSDLEVAYNPYTDKLTVEPNIEACIIPIVNLQYDSLSELLLNYLVPFGMRPIGLSEESTNCLSDMVELYKVDEEIFSLLDDGKIGFYGGRVLVDMFFDEPNNTIINSLHWKLVDVLREYYKNKSIGDVEMDIQEELLNCEKIRADIEPYEERILTDPNRGHWDLWINQDESQYTVEIADDMVARNPISDINENGVIAIDFGTKSTIVVYQSDIEHSLPMGIGDGNLSKAPSAKRYENPTVMHFVDLENFLLDYESRKGRPKTKWEDLTISHTAMEQFSNSKSEEYYEYLHQIKQWAGQREKQFRVQSHVGDTYVLPSFLDVKEGEWNPIEIYAYYIGLYINNMRKGHGIFLDYYLSFPVTYEAKIREKIVNSFERGLKKSLPETIVNNSEIMKRFHVNGEISEPAAYAVCALQEYGFEPEDDEEIFYGIFDFGGGTTDFDFGLWKQSAKRRYDYTIENFGAGGDEYLGGENLLEMLAFEIFKANQELMREKGFTFTLAPKCTEFLGSDSLLADSQEAEKNMHNLMEKVRPYWELTASNAVGEQGPVISSVNSELSDKISEIYKCIVAHPHGGAIEKELDTILENQKALKWDEQIVQRSLSGLIERYGIEFEDVAGDELKFVVTLFDKEGNDHANETLSFSKTRLNELIEKRISEGINNFFSALLLSYQNDRVKKPTTVNILLAGNSCRSPVVKKLFEEAIAEQEGQIKEKYNIIGDVGKLFEIFPPLGTEDAYEKMADRGLKIYRDDFEKPTGKTGVAYGLIQCRAGGPIERITNVGINDEIPFQYFIGWRSKKKFVLFKDESKITKYKGKPDYNVWYKFIEADDSVFDMYYTTLPECVSGELVVDGNAAVKRLRCDIDIVDENAFVYIRAMDPHTLEYVVAKNNDVESSKLGKIVRKEL